MTERTLEHKLDIVEAIAVLTNRSEGDVFYDIKAGKFIDLAVEALKSFSKNYYMMDRREDTEPVDDLEILKNCVEDLQAELENATDPKEIRELRSDIANLRQRIEITES